MLESRYQDCMSHDIRAKAFGTSQGFRPPKNLLMNINDSVPRLFRARKEPHGFRGAGGPERSLKGRETAPQHHQRW